MGNYIVRGTVYHDYLIEVQAETPEQAKVLAQAEPLNAWSGDDVSGLDIYSVKSEEDYE